MHQLRALRPLVLLGLLLVAAAPATASASASRATILTQGQRTLESRATVRVAVRARDGRYVVRLALRDTPAGKMVGAGARTVRLTRGRQQIVAVALNGDGRRLVGRCRVLRATVTVSRGGRRVARATRALSTSGRRCAKGSGSPAGPASPTGSTGAPTTASGGGTAGTAPGGAGVNGTGGGAGAGGTSGSGSGGGSGTGSTGSTAPTDPGFDTSTAERCDPIDPAVCLQPFPNNHFTAADPSTATKRRLALNLLSMPRNTAKKPIDPAEINVSDGFSPGSSLVTRVPGLDGPAAAAATRLPPIDDPAASLAADSPVVVLEAETGKPHPVWAEIDANPADPAERNLIIRPAINFAEGKRYVVGLRRLKTAAGAAIEPSRAFRVYRDRIVTSSAVVEQRRPEMEDVFGELQAGGVAREDLSVAWDFTVATAKSSTARMLSIRDRAFASLGDTNLADRTVQGAAPSFTINRDIPDGTPEPPTPDVLPVGVSFRDLDGVRDFTPAQDPKIARIVRGTYEVPCFLTTPSCASGGTFAYTGDKLTPTQTPNNTAVAQFTCEIPRRALDAGSTEKLRPNLYGHGLFGGQGEVQQGQQKSLANEHGFMPCATDWDGMATKDVPTALGVLQDLSQFPALIDHVQQGFLHQLFLGRLMIHPAGFSSDPAFRNAGGASVIDTRRLFYDGNSQGGIYGGTLTAIAPDFERAVLGVPGMNYSTLLPRSVDFDTYANGSFGGFDAPAGGLYDNYPNELERPLILALLQVMWDRGDPNGYARHMTADPLPNTPSHEVLMHVSFGDHQVADVAAEVMARTVGARVHRPGLEPGRARFTFAPGGAGPSLGVPPFPMLESLGSPGYSATGSGVVFWDIGPPRTEGGEARGEPAPPAADVPPRSGKDPHEAPRNTVNGREQKSAFLRDDGQIIDVCHGPCFAFDYTGGALQP